MKSYFNFLAVGLLSFYFSTNILHGQSINGKVIDKESGEGLEGVQIYILGDKKTGGYSDKNGVFNILFKTSDQKTDSIVFTKTGYNTFKTTKTDLKKNQNEVFLSKIINTLDEVVLETRQKLQSRLNYKKRSNLKQPAFSFASVIANGNIYVFGGDLTIIQNNTKKSVDMVNQDNKYPTYSDLLSNWQGSSDFNRYSNRLFVYDIDRDIWEKNERKLERRAYHEVQFFDDNFYLIGGKILSAGGKTELLDSKIEVVSIDTVQTKIDQTNPHMAVNFASFLYKDNLIVMGGSKKIKKDGKKEYIDKIRFYNLSIGNWYDLGTMSIPKETQGVLINEKAYLIGGSTDNKAISTIESWNLITGKTNPEGELFQPMERPGLAYHDRMIYIFENGKMLTYDIQSQLLKEYHVNLHLKRAGLHYFDHKLYIIGGYEENEYGILPGKGVYEIDLMEFIRTKPARVKSLYKQ